MTLRKLVELASPFYDHIDQDFLLRVFDESDDNHGDGLAKFVVVELRDTYDPDADDAAQLKEACRVMRQAIAQLEGVLYMFIKTGEPDADVVCGRCGSIKAYSG